MNKVQILLSTYNGEKYLEEQIKSILNQQDVELSLLIRDDGSKDSTIKIIEKIAKEDSRVKFYTGNNLGPARSFMNLLKQSDKNCEYYAFADQDDAWNQKKIINAINMIKTKENEPSLYLSALEIVDANLNKIETKLVEGNFCLEGEIIKNFATGCTMVLNKKLLDIINSYEPKYLIMHDSWITRVCYAIGGNVIIDQNSYIKYRQHSNNTLGYKDNGLQKLIRQFKIAFVNEISMRANIATELKNGYSELLTEDAKELINNLINYRTDKKAKKWLLNNKDFKTTNSKLNKKMKLSIILNKF